MPAVLCMETVLNLVIMPPELKRKPLDVDEAVPVPNFIKFGLRALASMTRANLAVAALM
jgi:hypothetical protein